MKSLSICAGLAALTISFASAGAALAANPHILIVDRKLVLQNSKLGQNIRQQMMTITQSAQSELGGQNQDLENQQQALQAAKLPDAERAKRRQALQAKEAALRAKIQDRQSLIQGGEMAARKYFMDQINAVVHDVMTEHGADAVLDKNAVVASANGADVTTEVVQRLDKKAASFKVPLVKAPLSEMLQMQGPQQQ